MDFLQGIIWEDLGNGQSAAYPSFQITDYFEVIHQPADGNCFYHSIAELSIPDKTEHSFRKIKQNLREAADVFYDLEPEGRAVGVPKQAYIEQAMKDNEWGGSLEASMLSKHLGITIVIWIVEGPSRVVAATRFGTGQIETALHLLHVGHNHFDALRLLTFDDPSPQETPSILERIGLVEKYTYDGQEDTLNEEELLLPSDTETELEYSDHVATPRVVPNAARLHQLIKNSENIPVRVGRVLDCLFSCKLCVEIKEGLLMLTPERKESPVDALSLRQLGHKMLTRDKQLKAEFSKSKLYLTRDIMDHLDVGGLLRSAFPGMGLERNLTLLHSELVLDICTVVVAVLLSTFLYGSNNRNKKRFITNCLLGTSLSGKRVMKAVSRLTNNLLYRAPRKALSLVCRDLYGRVMGKISASISLMSPISLLALRNLDFDNMELKDYLTMIQEMSSIDNTDVEFTHREISDLNLLTDRLTILHRDQQPEVLLEWYDKETVPKKVLRDIRNASEYVINDYFKRKDIMKFISTSGKASSTGSIGNVLSYAHNLYLSKESLKMTSEDVTQLLMEIKRLYKLQGDQSIEPIALICDRLEDNFRKLFEELPEECAQECKTLFEDIRNSSNHSTAWKHALRLKGTAYEGMFSRQYGWRYIPEDIKPSLTMLVQTLFPDKFEAFLDRTQLHPEFRDLTPDYALTQRVFFKLNKIMEVESRQLSIDSHLEESVDVVPIEEKKMFPLPETPVNEVNSIRRILRTFRDRIEKKDKEEEKKRKEREECDKASDKKTEESSDTKDTHVTHFHSTSALEEQNTEGISEVITPVDQKVESSNSETDQSETAVIPDPTDGTDKPQQKATDEELLILEKPIIDYNNRIAIDTNKIPITEEEELLRRQLLLIEVGFQTDVDAKISTDYKKWRDILKLLEMLEIKCSFVGCADCSSTSPDNWWISDDKVRLLKSSISYLFNCLSKNSPADVTDIVVGSISTQKVRSYLKSGSATKTPISLKDVHETWTRMSEHIFQRPTGLKLPATFQAALRQGLVEGVTMTSEGSKECLETIKKNSEKLIDEYERTKFKHELNKNQTTSEKLLLGWLSDDLQGARCAKCLSEIKQTVEAMTGNCDRLEYLATSCIVDNHCVECHPRGVNLSNRTNIQNRLPELSLVSHAENKGFEDTNETITDLDKVVRLTLPGKTEKERRVKRNVEILIKLMMQTSGIDCIKLPSGQIVSHRISAKAKVQESEAAKGRLEDRMARVKKELSESKLQHYSRHTVNTINSAIKRMNKQQGSRCSVPRSWLDRILRDLKVPTKDEEILIGIRNSMTKKTEFVRNNDKLLIRSPESIKAFIQSREKAMTGTNCSKIFSSDCVLFKEVAAEAMKRYISTPYQGTTETIVTLLNILCQFTWFQECLLYGKICETFLRCCTEFSRSGVKLVKIRHCDVNLAIKLPSNKKENMLCCVYSRDMELVKGPFFLNRRQAILGAAYPYILITSYVQVLQQHRCLEVVNTCNDKTIQNIVTCTRRLLEVASEELTLASKGLFEKAFEVRFKQCRIGGNFLNRSSRDHFVSVMSGLNIVYGLLIRDNLLANSQQQNKQLQMLRFGMLCGLSKLSCPKELGKKFSASCRRVEDNIMRLYLQSTVYAANRDVEDNAEMWKLRDLCPEVTIPCFSVYGLFVNSDRQLIYDIYNVHIYNKEMDNFDEGCISVLEETAERHMMWEMDLMSSLTSEKKDERCARLLLGCPNIRKCVDKEGRKLSRKTQGYDSPDNNSDVSSVSGRRSYNSSKGRIQSMFGRYNSNKKPFELKPGIEVSNDPMHDFQQVVTGGTQYSEYTPNQDSLLKDYIQIIRNNPGYTMGSFELIQAITEFGRNKYPPESIEKAKKDPKNWVSISEVTETTSIVSTPKIYIMLKDCYKVLLGTENKKIVKMLRGKLKKLGAISTDIEIGKRDCLDLLNTVDGLSDVQRKNIMNGIFEPSKLSFYHWKELVKKEVNEVLLTDDGNYIFCWLKTLSGMAKGNLKKHLKFMNSSGPDTVMSDLFTDEEVDELLEVKRILNTQSDLDRELNTDLLLQAWIKCIKNPKEANEIVQPALECLHVVAIDLFDLRMQHLELTKLKKDNPTVSFTKEEVTVKRGEKAFLAKHNSSLMKLTNLIFFSALTAPWCMHYKSLEAFLVRHPEILECLNESKQHNKILDLSVSALIMKLLVIDGLSKDIESNELKYRFLIKYLITLFTSNGEPFSLSLSDGGLDGDLQKTTEEKLLLQTKIVFAKIGLSGKGYDFMWTVQMIANSNFNVCKRLTGRTTGERLPRSVRSKVIYEMVKLVGETGMAILQQLAFAQALNYDHRFYAVLAPKAQLGGSRDLLVQETGTKVIHATTEMFSRNLLKTTNDDGLTNPHLKETILNVGLDSLQNMRNLNGRPATEGGGLLTFYRVVCISGDNTKWGPIHCCSFFSGMIQQLLKDVPDWCSFYKLTFIKNLCRQVEIPSASIKKILNVLRFYLSDKGGVERLSEEEIRQQLCESLDLWGDNDVVKFLITTYISKGIMAMNSYNHMGQGIHHATSSLLTSLMAEVFEDLTIDYFKKHYPNLSVNVTHAGSSDDYAKCIVLSGLVTMDMFVKYNESFWHHVCRLKNFTAAIQRCCQMKDSAKTLVGDCFLEFYSEFMMGNRVTPAVIKFIFTGLINSSVTSPQSLSQACHVSAQQAMYNSVPLLTNATFTLLRQQVFFSHVEDFIRRYGLLTLGTVSSFGRLFVPSYSGLVSSAVALEDSDSIARSASSLLENAVFLKSSSPTNLDNLSSDSSSSGGDDHSKASSTTLNSEDSASSSSSFTFELNRPLSETEIHFLKTLREGDHVTSCEHIQDCLTVLYADSKEGALDKYNVLYSSRIVDSCEWLSIGRKKGPLECAKRLQCVLNVLIAGHYRSFGSDGTEKQVKACLNRDDNRVIEDPMIQLIPEKLRRELERLGVSRMEVDELMPSISPDDTLAQLVAKKLISLNVSTEEYSAEVSRLKQTLTARNVLHGLAGGIKELSLPIYTIFMKSYFFKDNVFLDLEDRWSTKHSTNYRDSTGRMLTGRIVTKYTHWLDNFLGCNLSLDRSQEVKDCSLFNPDLRCVNILIGENNIRELSVVQSHLEVFVKEFDNLNLQFSDSNRQKLKIVESRPAETELEANKAVIVKSKLFSATEHVRLSNNPAVVMGYLLEESSISEVKPTKVDFSNLLKDRFKLMQFFPSVFSLVRGLQRESDESEKLGEPVDMNTVSKYANHLTLLCRMIQQAKPSLTVFYMLKGTQMSTEPTVSELISYGVKEGRYLKLPELGLDASTYSAKYWKILHCISAIGELPVSGREKTSLLLSFLNWKVSTDAADSSCPLYKYESNILSEFSGQVIINTLASELSSVRRDGERDSLTDLIDYVNSPNELLKKKPYLGTTCKFQHWGDNNRNGKFTYSSRSGEAIGIFIGGKLHIHLSKESTGLLSEVERQVLSWLSRRRTDVLTKEQHCQFLKFLPTLAEAAQKNKDGTTHGVEVDNSNVRLLKLVGPKKTTPVIKVKPQILTVKKQISYDAESEPRLQWGQGCVCIVYDECETETTYHEELVRIKKLVDSTVDRTKTLPSSVFSDTKVTLAKIRFKQELLLNSLCLLHSFLRHTAKSAVLELESKCTLLEKFLRSGGVQLKSCDDALSVKLSSSDIEYSIQQTLDEEISACENLNRAFASDQLPLSSWSEVQSYIEEIGFNNILVTVDKAPTRSDLIWKFSVEGSVSNLGSIKDLRTLVSYVSTETIPKFFLPFLLHEDLLSGLITKCKNLKDLVNSSGTTDHELNVMLLLVLFCFQNDSVARKGPKFSFKSLAQLITSETVTLNKRISAHLQPEGSNVSLDLTFLLVDSEEMKQEKQKRVRTARKNLNLCLANVFSNNCTDLNSLKKHAVNLKLLGDAACETLRFRLLQDSSGIVDYQLMSDVLIDKEKKGGVLSLVEDLILFMTGRLELQELKELDEQEVEPNDDRLVLDDLLGEDNFRPVSPTDEEIIKSGKITFDWGSDSD
uniref:RNA-directed RNA polymerase L n=1 Tax=Meram virus TaxID=2737675 RepID=A0A7G7Y1S5_9VIRU|nr:RNA-dependent RNA polymerase [Meram virus]QNH88011.1 RNA-dependent RNA polymerase [Meram virus]